VTEREQCSPPQPGDYVWRGDVRHFVMPDGRLVPVQCQREPGPRLRDRIADLLFCTRCFRLRFSPLHLLLCDRGRHGF